MLITNGDGMKLTLTTNYTRSEQQNSAHLSEGKNFVGIIFLGFFTSSDSFELFDDKEIVVGDFGTLS